MRLSKAIPPAAAVVLLGLAAQGTLANAARRGDCRSHTSCYRAHDYARAEASPGWFSFRFFGDFTGPCAPLLRKAIRIDTPDPRYWNAYDACMGF